MINFKLIGSLCLVFLTTMAMGQLSEGTITHEGRKCLEYKVERGKTMYSLTREYSVSQEELTALNPNLENGLKKGDIIYIPINDKNKSLVSVDVKPVEHNEAEDKDQIIHIVEKGETVFGICRQYKIKQSELFANNPEAKDGLKIGQELVIKGKKEVTPERPIDPVLTKDSVRAPTHTLFKDSLVRHVVQKGETMYSLSKRYMVSSDKIKAANGGLPKGLKTNDTLNIPIRTEVTQVLNKEIVNNEEDTLSHDALVYKDEYNVVIIAPLFLDRNALKESKRNPTAQRELILPTKIGVDFYAGALLALDSLKKKGISVNLNVFDSYNDTAAIHKILQDTVLSAADLIIGPFHSSSVKIVAEFAKENKIHMVIPVPQGNKVLYKNPYVSKAVTSTTTQLKEMAKYVVENYKDANIILVDSKIAKEEYMFNVMKNALTEELTEAFGKPMEPKLSYVQNYNANHLKSLISKDRNNIIIACSRNKGFATNFMTKVNSIKNSWDKFSADLMVFALSDWENFNSIDDLYKNKLKMHYVTPSYIDYDTTITITFLKEFRKKFGYDPDQMGFMGFDVTYNYVAALAHFGSGFTEHIALLHGDGVHTKFDIRQVQEGSGFENQSAFIIRYDGYHLIREK